MILTSTFRLRVQDNGMARLDLTGVDKTAHAFVMPATALKAIGREIKAISDLPVAQSRSDRAAIPVRYNALPTPQPGWTVALTTASSPTLVLTIRADAGFEFEWELTPEDAATLVLHLSDTLSRLPGPTATPS